MMNRIPTFLLILLSLQPIAAAAAPIHAGYSNYVNYSWQDQTAQVCTDSGYVMAAAYCGGQLTGLLQSSVAGPSTLDLQSLWAAQPDELKLFLTDDRMQPLLGPTPVVEKPASASVFLPLGDASVAADQNFRLQTGFAFPEASTAVLTRDSQAQAELVLFPPEEDTVFDPEWGTPPQDVPTRYVLDHSIDVTVTDPTGRPLQPTDTAGESELLLLSMDLSGLSPARRRTVRPMYRNPARGTWEDVDFYLDADRECAVICTDHLSTYGVFVEQKSADSQSNPRYAKFTQDDLDVGMLMCMRRSAAQEIFDAYNNCPDKDSDLWVQDVLDAMAKAGGGPYLDHFTNFIQVFSKFQINAQMDHFVSKLNKNLASVGLMSAGLSLVNDICMEGAQSADAAMSAASLTLAALAATDACSMLGPAAMGAGMVTRSLKTIFDEAVDHRDKTVETLYRAYYNSTAKCGAKRTLRDWKAVLDPMFKQDFEGFPTALEAELDRYVNQIWSVYGEEDFFLEYIDGGHLGFNKLPAAGPELQESVSLLYKQELLQTLTPLLEHYKCKAFYKSRQQVQAYCDALLRQMNRRIGIRITEVPTQVGGTSFYASPGGHVIFSGADPAFWKAPINKNGRALLDFRLKGYMELENHTMLDIFDAKGEKIASRVPGAVRPGFIGDISFGVSPQITYSFHADADSVPLLADVCGALRTADGALVRSFCLDESGRAEVRISHLDYEFRTPRTAVLYGSPADLTAGTLPLQTLTLSGFRNHTFRLSSVGDYTFQITEQKAPEANAVYKNCLAALIPLERPMTKEEADACSVRLGSDGSGELSIPVEQLHAMGATALKVYPPDTIPADLTGTAPREKCICHFSLTGKPGPIPITLQAPVLQAGSISLVHPEDAGGVTVKVRETVYVDIRCSGAGDLQVQAEDDSLVQIQAASNRVTLRGRQVGNTRLTLSYGQDTITLPLAVEKPDKVHTDYLDGLYKFETVSLHLGSQPQSYAGEEPYYWGLEFRRDENGVIQQVNAFVPTEMSFEPERVFWRTMGSMGICYVAGSSAEQVSPPPGKPDMMWLTLQGYSAELTMTLRIGKQTATRVRFCSRVAPWYNGDRQALKELYEAALLLQP